MSAVDTPPVGEPTRPMRSQAARYAALSVLSFAVNLGLTVLLHAVAGLPSYLAVAVAMAGVTVMNFCTIRLLVFDHAAGPWPAQLLGYVASTAGFRAAEYAAFVLLVGVFALPYLPVYAGVLAAAVVGKFLLLRGVVFVGPARPVNVKPGVAA